MKIYPLNTGFFKLDGGAMFGVVPKVLWSKTNPSDASNLCNWAMRCMLVEYSDRLVLIDTGIGDKQSEKFFSHYHLSGNDSLVGNLAKLGFTPDDITDVFLTHLHFDHCGGAVVWNKERTGFEPFFKRANYWSTENHWDWATNPNPREKASFLSENIVPLMESGQLRMVPRTGNRTLHVFPNFDVLFVDGHTESMMIPLIHYKENTIAFMADLLPSTGHIPLPYVMGYDTRPLITLKEKEDFVVEATTQNYLLFFEHDSQHECGTLHQTEKGIRLNETFRFDEFFHF
jgi:glyoxylase-like metal-dependent hydrolase (beta-lactamase superfamily II)